MRRNNEAEEEFFLFILRDYGNVNLRQKGIGYA